MNKLKTWVEISKKALEKNIRNIREILAPKVRIFAVVKSNAYGHGLAVIAQAASTEVDGFCVDSVLEGLKLRKNGLKKPILVLGPTLPGLLKDAAENSIIVSISNSEALKNLAGAKLKPKFHLKIDTGMHRQGFYPKEIPNAVKSIKSSGLADNLTGVFTHFASAKDINYPTYTDMQFDSFKKTVSALERSGFKNLLKHASATGGTLINAKYHLNAVRIGIGLYGLWPSKELQIQKKELKLNPVLSWHSVISEIKILKKGDYVGYDLAERVNIPTKIAVIPIGYWHGFPRSLSGSGEILIKGKRSRVLGRVSMDLLIVNVNGISCKIGDRVTIIRRQKSDELNAFDVAQKCATIHYQFLTGINPLIERRIK